MSFQIPCSRAMNAANSAAGPPPPTALSVAKRSVTALERSALYDSSCSRFTTSADVPTVQEMGYREFETSQWYGILAPAGTPAEVVKRLQEESYRALRSSAVTERFATDNAVGGGGPSAEFAAFIAREQGIWKDIVRKAQIKAD